MVLSAQHLNNKLCSFLPTRLCCLLSVHLQDNCGKFVSNMQQLQDSVAKYVAAIDQQVSPAWQAT
jgi:hypothetical protein